MADPIDLYVIVVLLGVVLTIMVGLILYRAGGPFLEEVFDDPQRAHSINGLLMVLLNLVVLGVLGLISVVDIPWAQGRLQLMVAKLGVVLLVLGAAHGLTMYGLGRVRSRRLVPRRATRSKFAPRRARVLPTGPPVSREGM